MKQKTVVNLPAGKRGTAEVAAARLLLFVEAYIANGGNGVDAAVSVGILPKNARHWASRALQKPEVINRLKAHREALAKQFRLDAESVLAQLATIVYFDPREMFDDQGNLLPAKQWPKHVASAVASFEVNEVVVDGLVISHVKKVKILDKNSAIEKAMRHLGQFAEDNRQKQGMLASVSPEVLKLIRDRLEELSSNTSPGQT